MRADKLKDGAIVSNQTKHTPGPWQVLHVDPQKRPDGKLVITSAHGDVAWLPYNANNAEARWANAPLIAAAPELYSELVAYHDREWFYPHEGLPKHKAGEFPDECGGCAAIAKVEGR